MDSQLEEAGAYLAHYGVLGMKWGVRKDDRTKQERREAKAQEFVKKARQYQSELNRISSIQTSNTQRQKLINKEKKSLSKKIDTALKDAEAKRNGKLTSTQKKVIAGAAVVATLIAAKITYDNIQKGEFNRIALKGKAFLDGKKTVEFARNEALANKDLTTEQLKKLVVDKVNPDYGKLGTKMNCRRATFAYEMRRRGFDVAATKTTNAYGQNIQGLRNALSPGSKILPTHNFAAAVTSNLHSPTKRAYEESLVGWKQGITTFFSPAESIFKTLADQPDGSRGELTVKWTSGGGHSMAYEIIKGVPTIIDAQNGNVFGSVEEFTSHVPDFAIKSAGFTRLDDKALNQDYLLRWVKSAVK